MRFGDYVTITAAAAVSAFAVLALGTAVVLPMVCPDGFSADTCRLPSKQRVASTTIVPDPAPIVAKTVVDPPQAEIVEVAAREELPNDGVVPTRKVRALVVKPQFNSAPVIVGLSAAPEPTAPAEAPAADAADETATASIDAPTPLPAQDRPSPPDDLMTITTGAHVRSGPTRKAKTVFSLVAGEDVTRLDKQKGWIKIRDDEGRTGWVYSDFVD